jgi:hypothetical protein
MVSRREPTERPDAFISHSSRDKDLFVRPLVECLADQGATVWYDEYSMAPGDSLSASIDTGLAAANCGLVVISPSFIETARDGGWTRYEFRGIIANSIGTEGRRVVPLWLDVSVDEVRDFSPPLSDLLAIDASGKHIEQVALEVLSVVAPKRAGGLARHRALMTARGTPVEVSLEDLHMSPAKDRRVGGHVALRALLVMQALADCGEPDIADYDVFLENLSRDLHHEKELRLWEALACSYSVVCTSHELSSEQKTSLLRLLLTATFGRADHTAVGALGADVAAQAIDHFGGCMRLARGEAVIGEGGLRGLVSATGERGDQSGDAPDD